MVRIVTNSRSVSLEERVRLREAMQGPRVGDYVGERRISLVLGGKVLLERPVDWNGFRLDHKGRLGFSGIQDTAHELRADSLVETGEIRAGECYWYGAGKMRAMRWSRSLVGFTVSSDVGK